MRDGDRAEAERLWERAVEEEVRRSGGRLDAAALRSRGRAALDTMAASAAEEYAAYLRAVEAAEAGPAAADLATPAVVTAVAAAAAVGGDLALG
ncbi:hypothetical protein, partial [Streptomyces sp. NPDC126499]|uniref:hypothetical protein n=1 Tax=Streptomyces sp. NPDC126499 TaxID=3155314 RepID=UPI003332CFD3